MKIFCLIPARGGSKDVPQKNIKPFLDKPLIVHSIDYARSTELVTKVFVSTDDSKITEISENAGATVIPRPDSISGDTATTESAIEHAIDWWEKRNDLPDVIILLQATSPLRPSGSLDKAINHFLEHDFDSLLSVSPTHRFFWKIEGETARAEYDYMNRPRRQDMNESMMRYIENGSLYLFTRTHFQKMKNRLGGRIGYVVFPEEYSLEIDTPFDFALLENKARQLKSNK